MRGDIGANLAQHLSFARAAAEDSVSFLLFPELSLTGYELPDLADCVVHHDDALLAPLRDVAQEAHMTIVVGAPIASNTALHPAIGAICLYPDGTTTSYRKCFLHAGEEAFASPGTANVHCFELDSERVALAICADTVNLDHPRWARQAGATIYAAGVLWSSDGYEADAALVRKHSASHGLAALVANHASPTGGYLSAGKSAFWAPGGQLLCTAPEHVTALLVAETHDGAWACTCRRIDA